MKDFYTLKEELVAVAETYANLNEAFKMTKSNYVKIKSHFKLSDELEKFVVKKGGHLPTNRMHSKLDVSKPKGFNIPEFASLIHSLSLADEGGMDDLDPKTDPWTNKMARVKVFNKKDGLELVDPDADYSRVGVIGVIRAQIFIIMTNMFEANPEFMKQYGTPEQATQMFI